MAFYIGGPRKRTMYLKPEDDAVHCNQTQGGMRAKDVTRNRWITSDLKREKRVLPTCAMRATQVVTEVVLHGYTSMNI